MKNSLSVIFILSFIVIFTAITSISLSAEEYSGSCGNGVVWAVDTDKAELKISGSGIMEDYEYKAFNGSNVTTAPWRYHISSIKHLVIDEGVTSVGAYAFYGCSNIEDITIPKTVTELKKHSFEKCKYIEKVYITDISAWCGISFNGYLSNPLYFAEELYLCDELVNELIIPDTVEKIGEYAFYRSRFINVVILPDSLKTIGYRAFAECSYLEKAELGNGLESIGNQAFMNCSSLSNIIIPDGVTSIGNGVFKNCSSITDIDIPDSVTTLGSEAFHGCTSLEYVKIGESVAEIGFGEFNGCSALVSVNMGNSVTKICNYSFQNCTSLTAISLSPHVESIGDDVFKGCSALESIDIPDSVIELGSYAFKNCSSLESAYIPDSVEQIGPHCFENCTSLANVRLSESLKTIPYGAFYNCTSLAEIDCSGDFTKIETMAFYNCKSLNSIYLPDSLEHIGEKAFSYCESLSTVEFGSSLKTIYSEAFLGCSLITNISLPASVTYLGSDAFLGCDSIKGVYIEDIMAWCQICFFNETANPLYYANKLYLYDEPVTDIYVTDGVEIVRKYAFYNCDTLRSIILSDSVKTVSNYAFYDCDSLNEVRFINSVKTICDGAFYECDSLSSIHIPITVVQFGSNIFSPFTTVICSRNSYAHAYAASERIPLVFTSCNHIYMSYLSDRNSTCISDGTKTAICELCGITDTVMDKDSVLGHDWSDWYITVEPTFETHGYEERICCVCFKTETNYLYAKNFDGFFTDIKKSHWFYSSVEFVVKKGYMNGMSNTAFSPNSNITREQFVLVLANIAGVNTNEFKYTESGFTDVKTGQWYSGAVTWAVKEGYVNGMSETKFGRGQPIQRAALARMLYNYAIKNNIDTSNRADLSAFGDAKEFDKSGNAWMKEPVQWAVNAGIISGMNVDGKICVNPKGTATRAQSARMLMQFDAVLQVRKGNR